VESTLAFSPLLLHRGLEHVTLRWTPQPWGVVALHIVPPLAMLALSLGVWRAVPPLPARQRPLGGRLGVCVAAGLLLGALAAAVNLLSMMGARETAAASGTVGADPGALALVAHVLLMAPVAEELAFRGVLYRHLRQLLAPLAASVLSAAIFALMHASASQAAWALVLGLSVAVAYEQTGSLVPPVLIHGLFNAVPIGVAVARARPSDTGPIWLALGAVAVIFTLAARSAEQAAGDPSAS
jgi:membrane protease YdiL (CAAX protease family)